jgi:hypothetical protein
MTRAGPPTSRVTEITRPRGLTLLGFLAPTAHEVAGSDLRRACLARLCCVFRLPRPLDAFFPPSPCRSCFVPAALLGFALQRVSLPIAGTSLDVPCPSWRFLSTVARAVMSPEHRYEMARVRARSVVRVATRLRVPLSRKIAVTKSRARTRPVSSAPPGVSARIGSPYSGRRVLPRTMGADPLLGFSALQGFPPPRLDPADAESPLLRFVTV